MKIAAFISDHGFGHAARSTGILAELMDNGCEILIISNVPEWFFRDRLKQRLGMAPLNYAYHQTSVDVGLEQKTSIEPDYESTLFALEKHWHELETGKLDKLTALVKDWNADRIYFDLPAVAPLVADKLGLKSIGMGNFSWDWIYYDLVHNKCDYCEHEIPDQYRKPFEKFIALHRQAYSKTSLLMRLPYSGDFSAFTCPQIDLAWIGQKSLRVRQDTLQVLGLNPDRQFALYSFGGHDLPINETSSWCIPDDWELILVGHQVVPHRKLHCFTNARLAELGLNYSDIIAAVDVAVTKPGFGILTDCIFNETPMLHISRGQFAEYPMLLEALDQNLVHLKIPKEKVIQADFFAEAESLILQTKLPALALDGIAHATRLITNCLYF